MCALLLTASCLVTTLSDHTVKEHGLHRRRALFARIALFDHAMRPQSRSCICIFEHLFSTGLLPIMCLVLSVDPSNVCHGLCSNKQVSVGIQWRRPNHFEARVCLRIWAYAQGWVTGWFDPPERLAETRQDLL